MNSMEDLNGYGATLKEYTDQRNLSVTFGTNTNQTVYLANSTQGFSAPVGCEITEAISVPLTGFYQIDVRGSLGNVSYYPTVTWPTVPSEFTVTNTTPGIYRITGPMLVSRWDIIKSPTITYPAAYHGPQNTISSTISVDGDIPLTSASRTWTTTVNWRYDMPYTVIYDEDTVANLAAQGNWTVSDPDQSGKTYTVSLILNPVIGNLRLGSTNYGGNITLTNRTQSNVNTTLDDLKFLGNQDEFGNSIIYYSQSRSDGVVQAANVAINLTSTGNLYDPVATRTFSEMHIQGGTGYTINIPGFASPDNIASVSLTDGTTYINWIETSPTNSKQFYIDGGNTTMNSGSGPYTLQVNAATTRGQTALTTFSNVYLAYEMIGNVYIQGKSNGVNLQNGDLGQLLMTGRYPVQSQTYTYWWLQNLYYRVYYRRSDPALHGTIGQTLLEVTRLNQWRASNDPSRPNRAMFDGSLFAGYHGYADGDDVVPGFDPVDNLPAIVARAYFRAGHRTDFPINVNHPNYSFNGYLGINSGWTWITTSNGLPATPTNDLQGAMVQLAPYDISALMPVTPANAAAGYFDFTICYIWKRYANPNVVPNVTVNVVKPQPGTYNDGGILKWLAASNSSGPIL